MDHKRKIVDLIVRIADEFNERLEEKIAVDRGAEAPLYGKEGVLDSLGLVTFVTAVEQGIEDDFGVTMTFADEKAVSQRNSPFQTVGSLADYAESLMQEVH